MLKTIIGSGCIGFVVHSLGYAAYWLYNLNVRQQQLLPDSLSREGSDEADELANNYINM